MMHILRYLDPRFLRERRHLVPLYLRNYSRDFVRYVRECSYGSRRWLAEHGMALTAHERLLASMRDTYLGRRGFVIGNGPSLQMADLERLRNEITFASNRIYVCFNETSWRPTFYSAYDVDDFPGILNDIAAIDSSLLFLPLASRRHPFAKDRAMYFRNIHRYFFPDEPEFSFNTLDRVFWGGTITYILLQLAWYVGIREVYLVGVDHDYKVEAGAERKPGELFGAGPNSQGHFHPDYHKPGERVGFPELAAMTRAYEAADRAFRENGGRIYNATRGGKLEVFERVDLDAVLKREGAS
ncbi:MAG: hypothetical protein JXQ75_21270 [Phycisphaerae bacterium]|nr:hypothetical protein [Phycisphaerae bacterium]